jgi:TolB-like protein/Tfp pilus assembly protein PilF
VEPKRTGFWREVKRRRVLPVAAAYAVVGLGVIEGAEIIFPRLSLPDWTVTLAVALVLVGFPVALLLAWTFEVRRDSAGGVLAEKPAEPPQDGLEPGSAGEQRPRSKAQVQAAPSVAVLPFETIGAESEGDYFADGITEELTNALAKQGGLRVAARTSAFAFKGERIDVREIGARLDVSHVIEGSVRRAGQTLRITAQLINSADGYHLWSEQYDRDAGDVFRIQEEIAGNVVEGLLRKVSGESMLEVPRTKLDAYEAFLRGRQALATFGPQSVARAIEEFETCIRVDGSYAPAFVGLAEALTNQSIGFSDHPPGESMRRAKEAAARALELAPDLPEGHLAQALVLMWHEFDFDGAKAGFDRALQLSPNLADAYLWTEFYWTYVHRNLEEALRANRKAQRLSPLDPRADLRLGTLQMVLGNLEEAERIQRKNLELDPESAVTLLSLGDTLFRMGRFTEAIAFVEKAVEAAERPTPWLGMLGGFYGAAGRKAAARNVLAELKSREDGGYVSGFWMAVTLAGMGGHDQAFSSLERAVEEGDSNLLYLFAVPRALGLHDDWRFVGILDRIGLGHLAAVI